MTIRLYTNTEWDSLPHIILPADTDWDLTVIDHEIEDGEEWFDATQDMPDKELDPLFDDFGDYKLVHHVTEAMIDSSLLETQIINYQDHLLLHKQNLIFSKVDYNQY